MSADNWAECPYCKAENDTAWQVRKDALDASYGKVPVESFMAERELVGHAPPLIDRTFREDYEFWTEGDTVSVETYLLGFDGDLYGQTVRLDFYKRLRGEVKFPSLEALRQEILRNVAETEAYFAGE